MMVDEGAGMTTTSAASLPASLRGMLEELASADAAASECWILALLQRHGPGVVALLWRMLGREQDVLDAYQTVVCQLSARGPKRAGSDRAAYFYRSAINAAIEQTRRRRRDRTRIEALARHLTERPTEEHPTADVNLEHMGLVERLRAAVLKLPDHLRDVVVLHDLAGLDYRRVAGMLKITTGTARVYRRQAIIRLSVKLEKEALR
jgi:RNA polymerase sigma factor (sigma-70 family)